MHHYISSWSLFKPSDPSKGGSASSATNPLFNRSLFSNSSHWGTVRLQKSRGGGLMQPPSSAQMMSGSSGSSSDVTLLKNGGLLGPSSLNNQQQQQHHNFQHHQHNNSGLIMNKSGNNSSGLTSAGLGSLNINNQTNPAPGVAINSASAGPSASGLLNSGSILSGMALNHHQQMTSANSHLETSSLMSGSSAKSMLPSVNNSLGYHPHMGYTVDSVLGGHQSQQPQLSAADEQAAIRLAAEANSKTTNEKDFYEAIKLYGNAIQLNPNDYRFYLNRSFCYAQLELYQLALDDAQQAIRLSPKLAKCYYRKGQALFGLKKYLEAEKSFLEVLKLEPNCSETDQELFQVRKSALVSLNYDENISSMMAKKFNTIEEALSAIFSLEVDKRLSLKSSTSLQSNNHQQQQQTVQSQVSNSNLLNADPSPWGSVNSSNAILPTPSSGSGVIGSNRVQQPNSSNSNPWFQSSSKASAETNNHQTIGGSLSSGVSINHDGHHHPTQSSNSGWGAHQNDNTSSSSSSGLNQHHHNNHHASVTFGSGIMANNLQQTRPSGISNWGDTNFESHNSNHVGSADQHHHNQPHGFSNSNTNTGLTNGSGFNNQQQFVPKAGRALHGVVNNSSTGHSFDTSGQLHIFLLQIMMIFFLQQQVLTIFSITISSHIMATFTPTNTWGHRLRGLGVSQMMTALKSSPLRLYSMIITIITMYSIMASRIIIIRIILRVAMIWSTAESWGSECI